MEIPLKELVGRTNFKADVRVLSEDSEHEPMIREVLRVELRHRQGYQWVYWFWKPEPRNDGRMDCGYSGMREDCESFNGKMLVLE